MSYVYLMEDWVSDVAEQTGKSKKEVKEILTQAVACLTDGVLASGKARIPNLGVFKIVVRKAYQAINPHKLAKDGIKEVVDVPAKHAVKFTAATSFKV